MSLNELNELLEKASKTLQTIEELTGWHYDMEEEFESDFDYIDSSVESFY